MKIADFRDQFSDIPQTITDLYSYVLDPPDGLLTTLVHRVCIRWVKSRPKNMGPSKLYFRNLEDDANLLPKNMGAKFCF